MKIKNKNQNKMIEQNIEKNSNQLLSELSKPLVIKPLFILVLFIILLANIKSIDAAEMFCDINGYVLDENGNHVGDKYEVKISLIDSLGKSTGNIYSHTVNSQKGLPPEFPEGFFSTSFSQVEDCNYGETVIIEVIDYEDKKETILVGTAELERYNIKINTDITKRDSGATAGGAGGGAGGTGAEIRFAKPIIPDIIPSYPCVFEGYVIKEDSKQYDKSGFVSIKIKSEEQRLDLTVGPPPEYNKGYFRFDPVDLKCVEGEVIKLAFDDDCFSGSKSFKFQHSIDQRPMKTNLIVKKSVFDSYCDQPPKIELPESLINDLNVNLTKMVLINKKQLMLYEALLVFAWAIVIFNILLLIIKRRRDKE
ncbi:hypothetical protein ACFL0W_06385 [Nanoarchaeota archaeon]